MTIASAFNEIAVAQGGTAAKSGAITEAIDALNDALAGSDQPQAKTIEQAVRLLGEHIGGGGGGGQKTHVTICLAAMEGDTPSVPDDEISFVDVLSADGEGSTVQFTSTTYSVEGLTLPAAVVELDAGKSVKVEAESMNPVSFAFGFSEIEGSAVSIFHEDEYFCVPSPEYGNIVIAYVVGA